MRRDNQRDPTERFGRRIDEPLLPHAPEPNAPPHAPSEDAAPGDIGDIPPPPTPPAPPPVVGAGLGGLPGTGGTSFARPGSLAARPFASQPAQQRFGPGVPTLGGSDLNLFDQQKPLRDEDLARIMASISGQYGGGQ